MKDLRQILLELKSKEKLTKVLQAIKEQYYSMDELMSFFFDDEYRVAQRASWVVAHLVDTSPVLLNPYRQRMAANLEHCKENYTVIRNTLRVFQYLPILEDQEGLVLDKCFEYIFEKHYPVAIKSFSVTVGELLVKKYPELKTEFIDLLEEQLPYHTAAFTGRATKCLKRLRK